MTTSLTLTHLRFEATATTPLNLDHHLAGNNLRNGLASIMLYATCPETHRRSKPTPEHAATCPACWLLAAELDPGTVVREYALVPPQPPRTWLEAGNTFSFGITLFGENSQFLPYVVLSVSELGRRGVGPGRGKFELQAISAVQPFLNQQETIWQAGESLVRMPQLQVDWTAVSPLAQHFLSHLPPTGELTLRFLSPLRLEERGQPFKNPDFSVFFRRLLYRIDELSRQFANQPRREREEIERLNQLADQVRLVECHTRWHELWSRSSRKQDSTPLSGLTGTAVYTSLNWSPLLPWLIFGQAVQAGKSVTKGNGVYQIAIPNHLDYWHWLL